MAITATNGQAPAEGGDGGACERDAGEEKGLGGRSARVETETGWVR